MMDFANLVQKKVIYLGSRNLRDDDLDVLTKVLRESKVLEELRLENNGITLADGKFTDALAENRTLLKLYLNGNHIGIEGAKRLADDALKRNNTLLYINLESNRQIGTEGAKRLADALKSNNTLQSILLHSNKIGDEGAKSFAAAIVVNRTLRVIGLSHNEIGDIGAQSLAASLLVNGSLNTIALSENGITDKGGKSLANALRCNCSINTLPLWRNRISDDLEQEIYGILEDPKRRQSEALHVALQSFMEEKDADLAQARKEVASRDKELESKDQQIASLKAPFDQMKTIMETIDLSGGKNETSAKRPREEESNLATIQRKNQKIARVKQEKTGVEERLANIIEEKEATEAELEEVREDLDVEKETVEHQLRATDVWHRRFDEIANLAAAGPVDGAVIAEIRNRSLAGGS